jgi:hypothetical protein
VNDLLAEVDLSIPEIVEDETEVIRCAQPKTLFSCEDER